MDCNKDEAIRAKQIAEENFLLRDFIAAKRFALKALQLFPDLDGLPQLMAVLDVHLIAHDKLNGAETDWHGLLQVDSTADEATIRKQYRKFALMLHPDKNKAVGAEAAFKIIAEAWRVLSGGRNKPGYDLISNGVLSQNAKVKERNTSPPAFNSFRARHQSPPPGPPSMTKSGPDLIPNGVVSPRAKAKKRKAPVPAFSCRAQQRSPPPQSRGMSKPGHDLISNGVVSQNTKAKKRKAPPAAFNGLRAQQPSPSAHSSTPNPCYFYKSPTFWTSCTYCKMKYEYLRVFENQNLACPICYMAFVAREIHMPDLNDWWYASVGNACCGDFHVDRFCGVSSGICADQTTTSPVVQARDMVSSERIETGRECKKWIREERKEELLKKAMKSTPAKKTSGGLMATLGVESTPAKKTSRGLMAALGVESTPAKKTSRGLMAALGVESIPAKKTSRGQMAAFGVESTPAKKTSRGLMETLGVESTPAKETSCGLMAALGVESTPAKKTSRGLMGALGASVPADQAHTPESSVKIDRACRSEKIEAKRESKKRKTEEEKKAELLKRKEMESAQAKKTFEVLMAKWKASMAAASKADTSEPTVKTEITPTLEKSSEKKNMQVQAFSGRAYCSTSPDKLEGSDQKASKLIRRQKNVAESSIATDAQGFCPSKKTRALDKVSDGKRPSAKGLKVINKVSDGRKPSAKGVKALLQETASIEVCEGKKNEDKIEGTVSIFNERGFLATECQTMVVKDDTIVPGKCRDKSIPVVMSCAAIDVPDPDFYDFDKDRTESHFRAGQVWAIYDENDGMPRFYARINKVLSRDPFRVQLSWLEPWCISRKARRGSDSGFAITCGEFKTGKAATSECVNTFSHCMPYEKLHRGAINIHPRKGEVWAMLSSCGDGKSTVAAFAMVEILADFQQEAGVMVAALSKLKGFNTLFSKHVFKTSTQPIPPQDLSRFSHFVPAYWVSSHQVPGLVDDCWDLDPAATPVNLVSGISAE